MMFKNSPTGFGIVSRFLHWTIAFSIIGLIGLGWYMVGLSYYDRWYHRSLELHRVWGLAVLVLGVLFSLWKFVSPSPALPDAIARFQRVAAHAAHGLLLTMMLLLPVTGYLISTSAGQAVPVYGWFEVPAIGRLDAAARDLVIAIHYYCAYGTGLLATLHAAAALKHQFVDRDGLLTRMIRG
jgi:cytochrome b561